MREFKFRAWRHDGEYSHMIESPIGVYTALKHCLNDGVIDDLDSDSGVGVVEWLADYWSVSRIENSLYVLLECRDCEVIGNIFENPELLEVEQ